VTVAALIVDAAATIRSAVKDVIIEENMGVDEPGARVECCPLMCTGRIAKAPLSVNSWVVNGAQGDPSYTDTDSEVGPVFQRPPSQGLRVQRSLRATCAGLEMDILHRGSTGAGFNERSGN
jgi:hypothetical protein